MSARIVDLGRLNLGQTAAALERYAEGSKEVAMDGVNLTPHGRGVAAVVELVREVMLLSMLKECKEATGELGHF